MKVTGVLMNEIKIYVNVANLKFILRYLHRQIFNILFCPGNLSAQSSDDVICISGVLF